MDEWEGSFSYGARRAYRAQLRTVTGCRNARTREQMWRYLHSKAVVIAYGERRGDGGAEHGTGHTPACNAKQIRGIPTNKAWHEKGT